MLSFNGLTQIFIITWMNLRNIPQRLGTSAVAVFGVACVVGVFISVLSMAAGFERTMRSAGAPDTAIIMRAGATSELSSGINYETTQLVANLPGIARVDNKALSSPELFVIVDIAKRTTNSSANVPLRGVQAEAFAVRRSFKIIQGRNFEAGKNELIVGRGAQKQFAVDVGSKIKLGQTEWHVVGLFEAGGAAESELWCDVKILQAAYRRGNSFQAIRLQLTHPAALKELKAAIAADPKFNIDAQLESEYLAAQSEPLSKFIKIVGYPLAILMAIGAVFGAINTMYTSVSARAREIATLRAIGFGALPVAISTLVESLMLSFFGGIIGSIVVYLVFNGYTVSTLNFASFSQVVFDFAVTPQLLIQGVIFAAVIGFLGGIFPAFRAAYLPVATALREV
jgi:putative ABC transport system permease protein